MIKLWDNNEVDYGLFEDRDKAYERISEYLEEINFKAYYFRNICDKNNKLMIDYGSHTHFFYMQREDGERIKVYAVDGTEQDFCFEAETNNIES